MGNFIKRNENFRDESLKFSYPFSDISSLSDKDITIGTDVFLDAMLSLKEPAQLPLHISEVDGASTDIRSVKFIVSDNTGKVVARSEAFPTSKTSIVFNNRGVSVGVFVYNSSGIARVIREASGKITSFLSDVASFSLDVTHVSTTKHLRYIVVGNSFVTGDVRIIARHGVQWTSDAGALRLSMLGDVAGADLRQPVRSINGVQNDSIWLTGHPRANLRISSKGNKLTFIQAEGAV